MSAAHADLYRWVDPESGSVKFSSTPPPWFESGGGPQVERIPYSPLAIKPAPELSGAAEPRPKPAPQTPPLGTRPPGQKK